jgi:predicted RNA-binding protein with PIN domain
MRYLIDGYNLMHAKGLLGPKLGPERLRRNRERFLDAVVEALGPFDAARATVVFDAAHPPAGRPERANHRGIEVIYAVGDENADARIEALLAGHPTPSRLTVISSDRRVRAAALRRRAKAIDSDSFWTAALSARRKTSNTPPSRLERPSRPSPAETQHWLSIFADAEAEAARESAPGDLAAIAPTDADLARIAREVEAENAEW